MALKSKIQKKPSAKHAKTLPKPKVIRAKQIATSHEGDFQEIRSLIELMKKNGLAVFKFEQGDFKITLKTPEGAVGQASLIGKPAAPSAPAPSVVATPAPESAKNDFKEIKSPMVGTFYSSASPEAEAFVKVGQEVTAESVVCIIEAMKVMNEIKAEIAGKIVEVVAENGKPVQYGEVLFRVS